MPRSKKDSVKKKSKDAAETVDEAEYFKSLVYKIRDTNDPDEENVAFKKIIDALDPKIKKIAGRFRIPGFGFDDVYNECLMALRFKAVRDYDEDRGTSKSGPAMFDRFALLCIRRHLATMLKTAHQNRKRILNESKSLDQDRSSEHDDLSLINIIKSKDSPVLDTLEVREFLINFTKKMGHKMSPFESEVFVLYIKRYTYEEIAEKVLGGAAGKSVKAIDNALSRIKHKGWEIYERMVAKEQVPPAALRWFEKSKRSSKKKKRKK